jgi:hypothetical protein
VRHIEEVIHMGKKLNPEQAEDYLKESPKPTKVSSLNTMRVNGGGPPFYKEDGKKNVWYDTDDLDEWAKSSPLTKYLSTSEYPPEMRLKRKSKNGGEQ